MTRHSFAFAAAALATALAGASSLALAADPAYNDDSSRQERMDNAYDNYRNNHAGNASMSSTDRHGGGRFERAENSVKRGAHRTGEAIKSGAHKTAEALRRTGDKIKDKTTPSN
jgi:hypothetical protein